MTDKRTGGEASASSPWDKYPEHNTDSEECWCDPYVAFIDPETGNKVIVHRDFSA